MLNTLRRRFILSHVLPLLIIVPLMGIALTYVLEAQVLLPNLTRELMQEARLTAEIMGNSAGIWRDAAQAQDFISRQKPYLSERMMLLDPDGHLLASSDAADVERLGQRIDFPGLDSVLNGETSTETFYSQQMGAEIADAAVPVTGPDGRVIGIIRVTYRLSSVYSQSLHQRYLIAGVMIVGLFLGAAVGWVLALNLERPLHQVTLAAQRLSSGQRLTPLPEQGPEEVRMLLHAFNSLTERLEMLEQSRRQFLTNLVHELGRPLGAIHSAIQALTRGADQDAELRRELLAGVDEEVGRLGRLVDDLARLQDQVLGTLEINRRPVALSEWLTRVLATRWAFAKEKGLHWQVTIPEDLPTLNVDPDRLTQALGNLIHNAIKYTPTNGTVTISAGVENSQVWIRVSDTGLGVTPEEQAHIFTPFYRGHAARRFPQGLGLGLSIAHDLVAAHGGHIEVKSARGQGSHFTLWLPLD